MSPQSQERQHPLPLWVRWVIVLFVLLVILSGVVFWIIQGTQAIIPIAILTALGVLIGFFQVLPLLFPTNKHGQPTIEITQMPISTTKPQHEQHSKQADVGVDTLTNVDWGEAPYTGQFYGRDKELSTLKRWVADENCRLVAVLGPGGVGKTVLAARLAEQVKDQFTHVFWRSLQNAPPLKNTLQACIQFLSNQQRVDLPEEENDQISLIVEYLRVQRCLIVLDNVETVLQSGKHTGLYREGYEGYGKLLRRIGETKHQSCLLLTGREKPKEVATPESANSPVQSFRLDGLDSDSARKILSDKELHGVEPSWNALIESYTGNPLALKLTSQLIREVFDGDIAEFLKHGQVIFSDIQVVLDQQFERLSELEQELMYWLAIEREGVSVEDLLENIVRPIARKELWEALRSLLRRYLIEATTRGLTLQNVVIEYTTDRLVDQISEEMRIGRLSLFKSHALMKAWSKDYIRETQIRLIILPIVQRLLTTQGQEELENTCKNILLKLGETHPQQNDYTAGNVLNCLVQMQCDLRAYNFSHLIVRQAYLRGVEMPYVSFEYSNLIQCAFTDTFGGVLSVEFHPNQELIVAGTANGEVRTWDASNGTPLLTYYGHVYRVWSTSFNPHGNVLASGGEDQTVRLWEVNTGKCLKILRGHTNTVRSVAFSPDGHLLASSSEDQTVRLWDIDTGKCLKILRGHTNWVRSISFSPDGHILASGSEDQTVRLWDINTGECLKILHSQKGWIRSVAFSPDGHLLASA